MNSSPIVTFSKVYLSPTLTVTLPSQLEDVTVIVAFSNTVALLMLTLNSGVTLVTSKVFSTLASAKVPSLTYLASTL